MTSVYIKWSIPTLSYVALWKIPLVLKELIAISEAKTYSCFCELMKRMSSNFPHGGAMDTHFANMRSLIQVKAGVWK